MGKLGADHPTSLPELTGVPGALGEQGAQGARSIISWRRCRKGRHDVRAQGRSREGNQIGSEQADSRRGPGAVAADLVKNPWHTAKVRADSTGVALAGLLARTDADDYILVGHSLGARAMVTAAQTLTTNTEGPKIATVHLLGAAIGAKGDWRGLNDAVTDVVYNYYSANDKVLKNLYTVVQAGSKPAGLRGFGSKFPKIKDRNVSRLVNSHSDYCSRVNLA